MIVPRESANGKTMGAAHERPAGAVAYGRVLAPVARTRVTGIRKKGATGLPDISSDTTDQVPHILCVSIIICLRFEGP
jgi:hypothetical protein